MKTLYERLTEALRFGLEVAWLDSHVGIHRISRIASHRNHIDDREREPGPVAYCTDGGGYIALDSADADDFIALQSLDSALAEQEKRQ